MISRYTNPEMGRIWSDQRKYETWLQVELAAVDAMARAGIVPEEAAREIRARAAFSIDRIEEIEQVTQHDVIAFTTAVGERVGPWRAGSISVLRHPTSSTPRRRFRCAKRAMSSSRI